MALGDPGSLDAVRAAIPALGAGAYLNTGTAGPLPQPAATALSEAFAREVARGRIAPGALDAARAAGQGARTRLSALLRAAPDRLALLHHSTEGLNAAALGLHWKPGDVAVITDLEHAAVQLVAGMLRLRYGVEVRVAPLAAVCGGLGPEAGGPAEAGPVQPAAGAERVAAAMRGGRVRAVFLSHVSYATGAVLPVRAVADAAAEAGAAVVVDGAQAVGALPVAPGELRAAFYTVSGQKWLCGPEGTGALWVAPGWEERLLPAVTGYAGIAGMEHRAGHFLPAPGARRLEVGTTFWPGFAGLAASVGWLEGLGWPDVWGRTHALAARCRAGLLRVPGLQMLTPPEHAGLVAFRPAGLHGEEAAQRLSAAGWFVRSIPGWDAVRASLGFFLEEAEVDGFVEAVAALAG
jgi:L-cysteine/cystine lyase